MNYVYIGLVLLFVIMGGYMVYNYYMTSKKNDTSKFIENKEFENVEDVVDAEMYYFYTEWCPHCEEVKPVWDEIREKYSNKYFNISFFSIDCDKDKDTADDFNVKEYPSYVLVVKGKKYIYDAQLDRETFSLFLNSVVKSL